jgi:hypothetical protein
MVLANGDQLPCGCTSGDSILDEAFLTAQSGEVLSGWIAWDSVDGSVVMADQQTDPGPFHMRTGCGAVYGPGL